MRLNRLALGLASLTLTTGLMTGYTVKEVKNKEIEAMLRKNDTLELKYNQLISDNLVIQGRLKKVESSLSTTSAELEKEKDRSKAFEEAVERLRKEKVDLERRLQEPKKITVSRGGEKGQEINVVATAYTPHCKGCSGITATGIDVRQSVVHNGLGIISVDPRVIPLGSKVIIGDKIYLAADKGSDIQGHRIDVLFRTTKEALQFGRQSIKVTVISN